MELADTLVKDSKSKDEWPNVSMKNADLRDEAEKKEKAGCSRRRRGTRFVSPSFFPNVAGPV